MEGIETQDVRVVDLGTTSGESASEQACGDRGVEGEE
jgi:hypothetical protein